MQIGDIRANGAVINMKSEAAAQQPVFKEGDIVTAEVLSTDGKQMMLRLDGGSVIRAECEEGVSLSKGDIISLQVMSAPEGEGEQISMRLFGLEERAAGRLSPLAAQLARMGVMPGDRAIAVAEALARAGHGLSMKQLGDALGIMDRYPNMDASKAAFFVLNGIQPDQQAVDALTARVDAGQTLAHALADMLAQVGEAASETSVARTLLASAQAVGETAAALSADGLITSQTGEGQAAASQLNAVQSAAADMLPDAVMRDVAAFAREHAAGSALGGANPAALIDRASEAVVQASRMPPDEAAEHIAGFVMDAMGEDTPEDEQARFAALLGRAAAELGSAVRSSGDIGRLLRGIERMFADPERGGAQELRRAVDEAPVRLNDIRALAGELSGEARMSLLTKADQAMQQLKFSGDVQQFLYAQIPLLPAGEGRTAELYVMSRNPRNRALDPENVTIALALDTEGMGRVESVIGIEKKDVSLRFRLESEELVALVKSLTVQAHQAMRDVGYRLRELRAQTLKTPIDPVNVERVLREEFTNERRVLDVTV